MLYYRDYNSRQLLDHILSQMNPIIAIFAPIYI
jgi:hypothetical protein